MGDRLIRWSVAAVFALTVGHVTWFVLGPPSAPDHFVGGEVLGMAGPDPESKQLYLRRTFYLNVLPRHAWLQVLGRDHVELYVNGAPLGKWSEEGAGVAGLVNLSPYLQTGINVIAIAAKQSSIGQPALGQSSTGQPPVVAVDGAYLLAGSEVEHPLRSDSSWRCHDVFDRRVYWWFETDFDDRHWSRVRLTDCRLFARVEGPPRATTTAREARWITPPARDGGALVRREFDLEGTAREAWIRVATNGSYRLAVNGIVIDRQEDQLGTTVAVPPVQRTLDLTPLLRRGRNFVAMMIRSTAGIPRVLADLEVEDRTGKRHRLGTDGRWTGASLERADWLEPAPASSGDWQPCQPESGDLGIPPWLAAHERVDISLPPRLVLERAGAQLGLAVLIALLTVLACGLVDRALSALGGGAPRSAPGGAGCLALIPATVVIGCAILATFDPDIARQSLYRELWRHWMIPLLLSVPLVWGLLALAAWRGRAAGRRAERPLPFSPSGVLVIGLVVAGFWLRFQDLEEKPLQHDEASACRSTQGFLEHGFPSREIRKNLPRKYVETSELVYCGNALAALVFDDDRYVVRFPALCWGTLTILLMYVVGRDLFGRSVGLLAAAIYTFSPICIQMSIFGRYFSQTLFFTLLTIYLFWRTIRRSGELDHGALWLTALSFIAMYLSWQGSALVAVGMMLAALIHRRGSIRPMLSDLQVWAAMLVVGVVIALHLVHRMSELNKYMTFGTGISDLTLMPMWRYPDFAAWYYIRESSWNRDALVPLLGLAGAALLAIHHGFRRPVRFLLLIFLGTASIQALLLPVSTWRYGYHLTPLVILLSSASVVAGIRWVGKPGGRQNAPAGARLCARFAGVLMAVTVVAIGSGMILQLREMKAFHIHSYDLPDLQFPDMTGAVEYVRRHMREGDLLLASTPHMVDHLMDGPATDFWPQSTCYIQAVLGTERNLPLDRYTGAVMIHTLQGLERLFVLHPRIWYVLKPSRHGRQNDAEVSAFLRRNMEVVYESYRSMVLFRGRNHWPAGLAHRQDSVLLEAQASFLPDAGMINAGNW